MAKISRPPVQLDRVRQSNPEHLENLIARRDADVAHLERVRSDRPVHLGLIGALFLLMPIVAWGFSFLWVADRPLDPGAILPPLISNFIASLPYAVLVVSAIMLVFVLVRPLVLRGFIADADRAIAEAKGALGN